jgi:hypothetical protein
MPYKLQLIVTLLSMFLAVWVMSFAVWFTRALKLPQCCKCGAPKVRRSRVDGLVDRVALLLLLIPLRCSGCRARFYALRFPSRRFNGRAGRNPEPAHVSEHLAVR